MLARMTESSVTPAPASRRGRLQLRGRLLLVAAALALLVPLPWQALQSVGSQKGDTLDLAGFETRHTIARVETPEVHKGDQLMGLLMTSNQAAVVNKQTASRLAVALLLGLPGAFLVGRYPRNADE